MKLEDIHEEWRRDASLEDVERLDQLAAATPVLHAKYLRILSEERMYREKAKVDLDALVAAKTDRLTGAMPSEELRARGWEPERRRILGKDVERHLAADPDVAKAKLRASLQDEKIVVLESIVKMVMNRNFVVKSMIDWLKFKSGVA